MASKEEREDPSDEGTLLIVDGDDLATGWLDVNAIPVRRLARRSALASAALETTKCLVGEVVPILLGEQRPHAEHQCIALVGAELCAVEALELHSVVREQLAEPRRIFDVPRDAIDRLGHHQVEQPATNRDLERTHAGAIHAPAGGREVGEDGSTLCVAAAHAHELLRAVHLVLDRGVGLFVARERA